MRWDDKPWGHYQEQCFWQRKQLKPRRVPVYLGDRIIQDSKAGWDTEVWKYLTWRGAVTRPTVAELRSRKVCRMTPALLQV